MVGVVFLWYLIIDVVSSGTHSMGANRRPRFASLCSRLCTSIIANACLQTTSCQGIWCSLGELLRILPYQLAISSCQNGCENVRSSCKLSPLLRAGRGVSSFPLQLCSSPSLCVKLGGCLIGSRILCCIQFSKFLQVIRIRGLTT